MTTKSRQVIFRGNTNEILQLETVVSAADSTLQENLKDGLAVLWSLRDNTSVIIDGIGLKLAKNQLVFLTELHNARIEEADRVRLLRFNRPFYCIVDHDSEVGCKGILFFGASSIPVIQIADVDAGKFEVLWTMFEMEMQSKDNLQIEMLQVLLKRLLILCTRLYKEQRNLDKVLGEKLDVIREFYYLVEKHFREHRDVGYYASRLHKSPKTISNLFAASHHKSPLQIIHERVLLEARRQLQYTEKSVKEIAYALGYDDLQTFSRFFRTRENLSPGQFREISRNGAAREKLPIHQEKVPTL